MPSVVPAKIRVPTAAESLSRVRLAARLGESFDHRLALVVAPAGSGKTTLVAQFAATAGCPVAWYRAEPWEADEVSFVRHLEASLRDAVPGLPGGWQGVDDAARALESCGHGRAVLVVDDGHALEGTEAEAALGRFVEYAPPWLAVIVASRVVPTFNVSRMRVSGELLEIGPDDLRFRAWEVEQLYRDVYRDPVPPGVLAALARRTEGWAAGLQLFHLASRGKSVAERQRLLAGIGSRSRLVREYLARNVLAELPGELRDFLRETCVLGRLSGSLCDRYLGASGSGRLLEELVRRQVFTVPVEDAEDAYRYHEVLRSHLDRILVEDVGEAEARARFARAGALLEADGALAEALGAYARAEDWDAVGRLLHRGGERLAAGATGWLDALPPAIVRHEPWLVLASARRARGEGRWSSALEAYGRAETLFGSATTALVCRRERLALAAWLDPAAIPPADWTGILRAGLVREPMAAARDAAELDDRTRPLVRGLLWLAAGEVHEARGALRVASEGGALAPPLAAGATLAAAVGDLLAGEPGALARLAGAVEAAERASVPWLVSLSREIAQRAAGVDPADDRPAGVIAASDEIAETAGEPWSAALLDLLESWLRRDDERRPALDDAERRLAAAERAAGAFRRLGSGVLEAWSRGLAALAQADAGAPEAREVALGAESLGRTSGTPVARLLAYLALEVAEPARAADYALLARGSHVGTGLVIPRHPVADDAAAPGAPGSREAEPEAGTASRIGIRTFGGFTLEVDGRPVALDRVKPRARALLRLLATSAGAALHREVIQEALWPDVDAATGARSLQVAVSALRGLLGGALGPDVGQLIVREGDAYRLAVEPGAVDVRSFERALSAARAARSRGEPSASHLARALDLYRGELLPEDGPSEWVVERRDAYRREAVEAARLVAEEALAAGDAAEAVRACRAGLAIDRYADPLWRALIDARDRAGDPGAASRDRREYESVLAGLGVGSSSS